MKINMLILDSPPESLDKDIIPPGAFAIHADSNLVVCEEFGKSQASELASLIGVHDLRVTVFFDRLFERVQEKTGAIVIEMYCDRTRLEYQSITTVR